MFDIVGPILDVIKFVGGQAKKYFNYHRKLNNYVDVLQKAQKKLQDREEDIQQQLQDENHFGKKPKQEVENWFKEVEEKIDDVKGVEDKVRKGKYLFRSCLGKLVDETTQAIEKTYVEGHFSGSLVVCDPSTKNVKLPTEELVGAAKVEEEIYEYLIKDEVRKVGVCGMGGIGKTTIMTHVHNKLMEEGKIGKLIWATVSQNFDILGLQKKIASQLNEALSDNEETKIRAAELSEMLRKQGRYVLILDDVWSYFSLVEVGILEPTVDNGCKLVLTTRSEEVVRSMGCKKVQVTGLSMVQAWQLFLSKVGEDMLPNPELESTMKLIVKECDGLPLAIVTVASCMRGQSNLLAWENALNELRGHIKTFEVIQEKVFGCLKFSYDHLKEIYQECFLYCALYPEDHEIQKEEIIEHWMEEGFIDEMETRKAMRGCAHSILQKIEENCLLEKVEEGNFIWNHTLSEWSREGTHKKMHDVVRGMALHMTAKRYLVKAGQQLKELPNEEEWSEDLEKVSLMYNNISTIPQIMKSPKFIKLTTLLLSGNKLEEIPESFFEHFPNLKILDLSYNPIVNLPNSISNLEKLTALLFRGCWKLSRCPSLSKLQALKKLDLEQCFEFWEVPEGLEMLVNLRYLSVAFINIPDGLLSKLSRLQYLAILSPTKAEDIRELHKLEVFEGRFSNVCDFNNHVSRGKKLHKYLISVTCRETKIDLRRFREQHPYSKMVVLDGFDDNCGIIDVPCDIQQLEVCAAYGKGSLNDFCGFKDATDLKECLVMHCPNLESIFSSKCRPLETLETLVLRSLEVLKTLLVGEPSTSTFSSLKEVQLIDCEKIKNLFSAKWVLHNLEDITIWNCKEMEEIIESNEEGMGTIKYTLPKLRTLRLSKLPELKRICSENGVLVCDSLQSVKISGCQKLKRIPLYLPLLDHDNGNPSPPPSLKEISVKNSKDWWESLEWDHPQAKNVLSPFLKL